MTTLIVSQAVLNTFAVLGLAPLTGVPLPFVSYGSTSLIVMLASMGLLLNVAARCAAATCGPCDRPGAGPPPAVAGEAADAPVSATSRIVIAAGGTAGHVVPALAVAAALRADGAEVAFIGGRRAEATLVPEAGFELHQIEVEGLSRSHPLKRAARARCGRRWRSRARARCCARWRPTRSSAAEATCRRRSGWPRSRCACRWC